MTLVDRVGDGGARRATVDAAAFRRFRRVAVGVFAVGQSVVVVGRRALAAQRRRRRLVVQSVAAHHRTVQAQRRETTGFQVGGRRRGEQAGREEGGATVRTVVGQADGRAVLVKHAVVKSAREMKIMKRKT